MMIFFVALLCVLSCGSAFCRRRTCTGNVARNSLESETKQQLDFMKAVWYNRSYGVAKCAVEHSDFIAENKCVGAFLEDFRRFYLVVANFDAVSPTKMAICFGKSRLLREERSIFLILSWQARMYICTI